MKLLAAVVLVLGCDGALAPPEPPQAPPAVHRLVPGALGLVGHTGSGCSTGIAKPGLSADLWCAFYRAGAQEGAGTELWVLNVSRAATREVRCDGTDPLCLRLTTNLWTGDPLLNAAHPGIHGFEGDTLMIYADASVTDRDAGYRGSIKGWRPGWSAARTLTSPQGYLCRGSPYAAAAHCLDNVVEENKNFLLDLRAGALSGSSPGPLATVARIRLLGSKGQIMWGAGFSPDGAHFLYSSPADGEDTEVLRLAPTTDGGVGPAMEIRRGAGRWLIAPDGKKLYFLDGYNYVHNAPSGALAMVDFPALTNPTVLQANVGSYAPLGGYGEPDRGLAFLQNVAGGDGTFRIQRDRAQPDQAMTVDDGVNEFLISPDLRFTYVSKPNAADGATSLVVSNEGQGSCLLGERRLIYSQVFAADSSTIFWAQDSAGGFDISEGWYAPSDRCSDDRRRFSADVAYLTAVRGGLVHADSDPGRRTMTLKFTPLTEGALAEDAQVVIRQGIDVSLARGGPRFVVFTVSMGNEPGLYAYGPLP